MRQIKYFTEKFSNIEVVMNDWVANNQKSINMIYRMHINQEFTYAGNVCVNGYIDYETIGGK